MFYENEDYDNKLNVRELSLFQKGKEIQLRMKILKTEYK